MASRVRISVVIATCGRDSLGRAVRSAAWADERIILFNEWGSWGARAKNLGMDWASGTHVCFMDDDDCYTPEAGDLIRKAVRARPKRIHIFSMSTVKAEGVFMGGVGLPMFIVPNIPGKLARFPEDEYACDFYFIDETVKLQSEPVFHEECIALIKPEA